jgi:hypothetical protein
MQLQGAVCRCSREVAVDGVLHLYIGKLNCLDILIKFNLLGTVRLSTLGGWCGLGWLDKERVTLRNLFLTT